MSALTEGGGREGGSGRVERREGHSWCAGLPPTDRPPATISHARPLSSYYSAPLPPSQKNSFYRSPEVILGLKYSTAIDMWSFGCVLAELLTGYPLFPGEDEHEQLLCIMEVMGAPPRRLVDAAPRRKAFFDAATGAPLLRPNARGRVRQPGAKTLRAALRGRCGGDEALLDLLARCLAWDAAERITPDEALAHPWFAGEGAAAQAAVAAAQQHHHQQHRQQQHVPAARGVAGSSGGGGRSDTNLGGSDVVPRSGGGGGAAPLLAGAHAAAAAAQRAVAGVLGAASPKKAALGAAGGGEGLNHASAAAPIAKAAALLDQPPPQQSPRAGGVFGRLLMRR